MEEVMKTSLLSSTAPAVSVQDLSNGHNGNGGGNGNGHGRHYHRHPRFRGGARLAALRAFSGAQLVITKGVTPVEAADWTGSNSNYVRAMVTIVESKDEVLLDAVLAGEVPVLAAAAQVEGLVKLLKAYAVATGANKIMFTRITGHEVLFDEMIVPAMAEPTVPMTVVAAG
jgi:hypothetical protein